VWGGIVARRKPGERSVIQIIAGEHRKLAALKVDITEADVFVGEFDDAAVVRIYARENATQRGNTSTALAGSIAAAVREITVRDLLAREIPSQKTERRGGSRDGIGQDRILEELRGVPGINENIVKQQLANLKAGFGIFRNRKFDDKIRSRFCGGSNS
jgi:ParB-like chromosome segregation protein Spo0J